MRHCIQIGLCCCLSMMACRLMAQAPAFRFSHLQEGLSHVLAIHQDRFGFLWFGTKNGLAQYDGYAFTMHEREPSNPRSLSDNWITSIAEDGEGNLYLGTFGGGLNILHRASGTFSALTHTGDRQGLPDNVVLSLCFADSTTLLVGTSKGLCAYGLRSRQLTHFDADAYGLPSGYMAALACGPDGTYWLGTDQGLCALRPGAPPARTFSPATMPGQWKDPQVRCLAFDWEGSLWAGTTAGGLHRLSPEGKGHRLTVFPLSAQPNGTSGLAILSLFQDRQGRLWIGTEGGGLNLFHPESQTFSHYEHDPKDPQSIGNYSIWSIAEDRVGTLWFGTFNKGVTKIDPYFYTFDYLRRNPDNPERSLNNNVVNAFYEAGDGRIWIGTDGGGLNIYAPSTGLVEHYTADGRPGSLSSNAVLCMAPDADGRLWVGTWAGGIGIGQRQSSGRWHFSTHFPKQHFFAIAPARSGNGQLWAGSWGQGLYLLDRQGKVLRQFTEGPAHSLGLSNSHVLHLMEDRRGRLWASTLMGLNQLWQDAGGEWHVRHFYKAFGDPKSLSAHTVLFAFEDSRGQIWVGTESGLNRFVEEEQTFRQFHKADGLPGSGIKSMAEDRRGNLWIATSQGLSKYDTSSQAFQHFDTGGDGLPRTDFTAHAALCTRGGQLYFGSSEGAIRLDPERLKPNPHAPTVYITDFRLFNRPVPIGAADSPLRTHIMLAERLTLTDAQSVFSLEFVGLNYTHPEKNRYAYRLRGLETEWNEVGTLRVASYSNLDARDYVFEVKACNNNGIWGAPRELAITVLPPWHETWYVRAGFGVLLLALAWAAYRVRVRMLERQKASLQREVKARTLELIQKKEEIECQAERLKDVNLSLEQKVAQRTADLAEAYAELNQFIYHSAHDLKGPIARLLGLVYLGRREVREPVALDYLQRLEGTAQHLNLLLSDLMGAQETKTKEVEISTVALAGLIGQACKRAAARAGGGIPLRLQSKISPSLCLDTDPELLGILFENLIQNAIDFRQAGEAVDLYISSTRLPDRKIAIDVRNNGIGVPPEVADRAFEMFVTGSQQSNGFGLGLYEARIIAQKLRGTLSLACPHPGNTVFRVVLPE